MHILIHLPHPAGQAEKNACLSADRDSLFLGVFDVVSRCVLRVPGRIQVRVYDRAPEGKAVYAVYCKRSYGRHGHPQSGPTF